MENRIKKKEEFFNKVSLLGTGIIGSLFGLVIILMSKEFKDFESTLIMIGQTIISISFSSLLLEWFGYVNYTRKRMCEILAENDVINILDMNRKKELKSALIKNIYMYNAPNLQNEENNISTIIDNEMDNILRDYYFDEYIIYIDASIFKHNNKKYVKKKMRHTFTAKTTNMQKCLLETPVNTYINPPDNTLKGFEITAFSVNGNPQDISKWNITEEDNNKEMKDTYPKHYSLKNIIAENKKLFSFNEHIDVDFEYTTIVDIDDLVYTYQINKACKHFCIHYNAPKEYKILMEGFGFMSTGNSQRQRLVETESGCMLRFLDWILPGNGVIIVLQDSGTNKSSKVDKSKQI